MLGEAFAEEVAQFNRAQNQVFVTMKTFNNYADLQKNLNFALQNRSVPDVAVVEVHQIAFFADSGKIQPLDELVKADPKFQPDDLLPGADEFALPGQAVRAADQSLDAGAVLQQGSVRGGRSRSGQAPHHLARAGRDGQEAHARGPFAIRPADDRLSMDFRIAGVDLRRATGDRRRADLYAGRRTILRLWADMVHRDKTARFAPRKQGEAEFTSGRAAMLVESSALMQACEKQSEFKVGVAWLPHADGGPAAVPVGGAAAVIPSRVAPEHQAAAWQFLTWLAGTKQTARWSKATGYVPLRRSACELLRNEGFYREHPEFEVPVTQLSVAHESPSVPDWDLAWNAIEKAMTAVLKDDAPAGDGAENGRARRGAGVGHAHGLGVGRRRRTRGRPGADRAVTGRWP